MTEFVYNLRKIFNWRLGLAVFLSGGLLWLAMRRVDLSHALWQWQNFNKPLMVVGLSIWLVGYVLRGQRWLVFLHFLHPVKWLDSFRILMVGFALNNLLPMRAGEFIRAYLLHQRIPAIPTSTAFATIAAERVFDGLTVVGFTLVGATSLDLPEWAKQAVWVSGVLFVVVSIGFFIMIKYTPITMQIVHLFAQWLPDRWGQRIDQIAHKFIMGLKVLESGRSVLVLILMSFLIWLSEVVFYYLSALSFGIELSLLNAFFLMGIVNLAVMIPTAPGGIGAFEFVTVQSLILLSVSETVSFSYGVTSHAVQNLSVIVFGLYYIWRMGFRYFDFIRR